MFGERPGNSFKSRSNKPGSGNKSERNFGGQPGNDRPFGKKKFENRERGSEFGSAERKPYSSDRDRSNDRSGSDRPYGKKPFEGKERGFEKRSDRPFEKKGFRPDRDKDAGDRPARRRTSEDRNERAPGEKRYGNRPENRKRIQGDRPRTDNREKAASPAAKDDGLIRLNRYIANAGICSRRKADELIEAGVVSVNGEVVSELGYKVDPAKDVIRYNGETLKREKMVYVLLNKPKDYITTTDDPQERRTVMHLVEKASRERIYPVGRLDRNTTGLLLMTNDGDLAEKLSHPRNNVTKIYNVELNKNLTQGDFNKIEYGLELEDGLIKPDALSYVQGGSKREVGIQIHSGKNRIVRRIFEHLGYDVVKLDRVVYGNLTKKDLGRGRWRYLEEKEIIQLKHLIK